MAKLRQECLWTKVGRSKLRGSPVYIYILVVIVTMCLRIQFENPSFHPYLSLHTIHRGVQFCRKKVSKKDNLKLMTALHRRPDSCIVERYAYTPWGGGGGVVGGATSYQVCPDVCVED